jgi:hypothetical protein
MTSVSSDPKVAYIYNQSTDTWHPVSGTSSTSADYQWSGEHQFLNLAAFDSPVYFRDVLTAKAGINNFQNPTARDAAISSPATGLVAFIRQDNLGTQINQIQYYDGTSWVNYKDIKLQEKTASHTLVLRDAHNLIKVNSSSNLQVIVPPNSSADFPIGTRIEVLRYGSGEVAIVTPSGSGITIRSVDNVYNIPFQYGYATLTKIASAEWLVVFSNLVLPVVVPPPPYFAPPSFPYFFSPTFNPEPPSFPPDFPPTGPYYGMW